MLNNHEEHVCKECEEKIPTFMELLKHVAKHHYKDKDEDSKLSSDEVLDNILLKDLEEKYEFKKTHALSSPNQCWMSFWTSEIIEENH